MPKATETTLEIDLNALESNFRYITSKIHPQTKLMAVVKAYSYGSDSVAIAKKLEKLKIDYLAVAYASEGTTLRDNNIVAPILVLHPLEAHFKSMLSCCLEPNLYSKNLLEKFIAFAEKEQLENYPVHIKINSGMNRLGFRAEEIDNIVQRLKNTSAIKVKSVFSHLAASEDVKNRAFAEKQIAKYIEVSDNLIKQLGYKPLRHTLNTSGILNFPGAQLDMVRSGIGLYGYGNSPEEDKNLVPVATLKTIISQIHHIKKGENVGYNFGFIAEKDMKTATLPLGHADGISRTYGKGKGFVQIHGKKAHTIGNICMDMFMVDVTEIDCQENDEVLVFGQGASAEDFAHAINSISYEIITAISQRVKRVVLN